MNPEKKIGTQIINISDRKAEYYQLLINSTVEGLLIHKDGIAMEVNDPLLDMFGYTRDQVIGKNMIEMLPVDEDKKKVAEHVRSGSTVPYYAKGKKRNGSIFDAEIIGRNISIEGEEFRITSIRDITDKVKAENALQESEQKFKVLVEALPDVIMVIDRQGKVLYANEQLHFQTGYHSEDLQFGKYNPFIYPEDREIFQKNMDFVLSEKKRSSKTFEARYVSSKGEIIWYSTIVSRIEFNGDKAIQIVSRNISETKEFEIELKQHRNSLQELVSERTKEINQLNKDLLNSNNELTKLNEEISRQNIDLKTLLSQLKSTQRQLIDSEKLASVGKLTEGLAHELNNPINWIGGVLRPLQQNIEELKEMLPEGQASEIFEEMNDLFESIQLGTQKISDIVKTLSEITPKGSSEKAIDIHLPELIYSSIYTLESRYPEVKFKVKIPENLVITAKASDIQQVFFNVMKNAADAVENMSGRAQGKVEILINSDSDVLKCQVTDNGPGIPEEIQNDIYEPFFTTKEGGSFLGLGLYIVKSIVSKYNGSIFVNSENGRGTIFSFTLPDMISK